ncbi:hypothetical protein KEH51_05030 [[Brevibacterium] frigoritolerans]|uniref:Uncharacterized protein n=1 Tax=Peribacillus frigoritolerans TaxID=450367 RepID=A0A941J707_9BACI|nr:hypothetical protein [Peribacillus frigoritolerans]
MKKMILAGMSALIIMGSSDEMEDKTTFGLSIVDTVRMMDIKIIELKVIEDQVIAHFKLDNKYSSIPVSWDSAKSNIVIDNSKLNVIDSSLEERTDSDVVQEGDITFDAEGKDDIFDEGKEVTFNLGVFEVAGFPGKNRINNNRRTGLV